MKLPTPPEFIARSCGYLPDGPGVEECFLCGGRDYASIPLTRLGDSFTDVALAQRRWNKHYCTACEACLSATGSKLGLDAGFTRDPKESLWVFYPSGAEKLDGAKFFQLIECGPSEVPCLIMKTKLKKHVFLRARLTLDKDLLFIQWGLTGIMARRSDVLRWLEDGKGLPYGAFEMLWFLKKYLKGGKD